MTDGQVKALRQRRKAGETLKDLCTEYGIPMHYARDLWTGRLRKNAGGPVAPYGRPIGPSTGLLAGYGKPKKETSIFR